MCGNCMLVLKLGSSLLVMRKLFTNYHYKISETQKNRGISIFSWRYLGELSVTSCMNTFNFVIVAEQHVSC